MCVLPKCRILLLVNCNKHKTALHISIRPMKVTPVICCQEQMIAIYKAYIAGKQADDDRQFGGNKRSCCH